MQGQHPSLGARRIQGLQHQRAPREAGLLRWTGRCLRGFCPQTNASYLVPVHAIGDCGAIASLPVAQPRNGQAKRVRAALDYLIVPRGQEGTLGSPGNEPQPDAH